MNETYTTCQICGATIDPLQPDAVLTERIEDMPDMPGSGQLPDPIWTPSGYAHRACLAGAPDYRAVADYST